jgi:hypothetical protein
VHSETPNLAQQHSNVLVTFMCVSSCLAALLRSLSASFFRPAAGCTFNERFNAEAASSSGGDITGTFCSAPAQQAQVESQWN